MFASPHGERPDDPMTVPADLQEAMTELVTSLHLLIADQPAAY